MDYFWAVKFEIGHEKNYIWAFLWYQNHQKFEKKKVETSGLAPLNNLTLGPIHFF